MKKKYIACIVALLLIILCPVNVMAETNQDKAEDIIYLEDGNYITITLSETSARASGTKSGSKTYRYYNSDDVEEWRAVLTGTFTYTGSSATCTAASCNVTITNTNWYVVSKTASKSNNVATADVTMGLKFLGITVNKENISIRITCNSSGTLN